MHDSILKRDAENSEQDKKVSFNWPLDVSRGKIVDIIQLNVLSGHVWFC